MTSPEVRLAALSAGLNAGVGTAQRLSFADLTALLMPIDAQAPAGEWLRYDPAFDTLRELRREDDATTPQGIWARELKRADLGGVHRVATDLLTHRTKDLQIAAWLLEAWIRTQGFAGARIGFALLLGLCDQYWPDLYPLPDGDDFEARSATIDWINERLPARLLDVAVTKPTEVDGRAFTWGERSEALRQETLAKRMGKNPRPQSTPNEDWLTTAKFTSSTASTPNEVFAELESDIAATLESVQALQALLDEKCGNTGPSLRRVNDLLTEIRRFALGVLEERGAAPASSSAPAASSFASGASIDAPSVAALPSSILEEVMQQTPMTPPAVSASPADNVAARTEAYRKLAEAADTLMRIEPHSPTPYLVRRAIAWGGMSLAELMRHFIDSGYDLKSLYTMLGMGE